MLLQTTLGYTLQLLIPLPIQDSCKVGHRGVERQAVLFEKLLLFVKRKDLKKYTYKAHIVVSCED